MSFKILIVDDHAPLRKVIREAIERNTDWDICGEAENGAIAVERVRQCKPEVVILDLRMPVMNGLDAARQMVRIAPKTTIVMLTFDVQAQVMREAEAVGVRRVFSKSQTLASLIPWLRTVAAESCISIP